MGVFDLDHFLVSFGPIFWSVSLFFLIHLLLSCSGRAGVTNWFRFDLVLRGAVFVGPPLWSETKLWFEGSHFWNFRANFVWFGRDFSLFKSIFGMIGQLFGDRL